ncbi:MAG: HlyC/CorC family transporter [Lachnospiraceae bacterium]|nr:HlyC/CorC family transporter [Lachnospiraceae bacterium]
MEEGSHAGFFSKLFRSRSEDNVEEEIVSMLNEGQDQGVILESEAEMITNIFDLDETDASEIMTHRKNVAAIDGEWTLQQAMDFIVNENFSRFPVYLENIDNIIGILHIKDAITFYMNEENRDKSIKDLDGLLQKAHFIPETRKVNSIFKNMQSEKTHMVIVVDEYGQTAGIVAMEDILEEIVGNIFDEHDEVEYNIVKISDNVYNVKGLTPLTEIEEETGVVYDDEENDTLNGYLVSILDRIPEDDEGTVVENNGVNYKILKVEDKTISLVRMEIVDQPNNSEE